MKQYLGSGASSDVYLAELGDGRDQKRVAVKVKAEMTSTGCMSLIDSTVRKKTEEMIFSKFKR